MRVIAPPPELSRLELTTQCAHCRAVLGVTVADAVRREWHLNELSYVFTCACCTRSFWIDAARFEPPRAGPTR